MTDPSRQRPVADRRRELRRKPLDVACVLDGRLHKHLAAAAQISEYGFSEILRGIVNPRPETMARIAAVLDRPVEELFPEFYADDTDAAFDALSARLVESMSVPATTPTD